MGENWVLAFRYASMEAAKPAWERVRDAIFLDDLDASVYRTLLNGRPLVIAVGSGRLGESLRARVIALCSGGEMTEIPDEVAACLVARREEYKIPGVFWERRSLH